MIRTVQTVGEYIPYTFIFIIRVGVVSLVLEDIYIYTYIELLVGQVLRQIPVELQIYHAVKTAVQRSLGRQGYRVVTRSGINLHGAAGGAGDLNGTHSRTQIDIGGTVHLRVTAVLPIRTAEVHNLRRAAPGLVHGVPYMTANT